MAGFELWLFGYREYRSENPHEIINLALRHGKIATLTANGAVRLSLPAAHRLKSQLAAIGATPVGTPHGLGGAIIAARSHIPAVIVAILAIFLYILSHDVVFDVRVEGNELLSEEYITAQLEAVGFGVGSRWSKTDRGNVEIALLDASSDIAWISINREGRVATVRVIELSPGMSPPSTAPANIVADRDCVIEEITVVSGTPVVKVGDTVRRGDLLISGIVETANGTEYVRAEGSVRGTSSTTLTTEIGRTLTNTLTKDGGTAAFSVKIFNFRINIYKNYGNRQDDCAIIESNKNIMLRDTRLPVTLIYGKYAVTEEYTVTLTDADLPIYAGRTHSGELTDFLTDKDLVRIKTAGRFTDDGYVMESLVVYSTDVGRLAEIRMEN